MNLKNYLANIGISISDFSRNCWLPYSTIAELISGKKTLLKCNASTVYVIAKDLGISVEELLKHNNTFTYAKTEPKKIEPKEEVKEQKIEEEYLFEDVSSNAKVNIPTPTIKEEKKYTQSREIFSSVFSDNTRQKKKKEESNEMFLNSLKEFRNNL